MKTFVTFGQGHVHTIGGVVFDKDCVAVIEHSEEENGRELAFQIFGTKFCFEYTEREFALHVDMRFFPRGCINVDRSVICTDPMIDGVIPIPISDKEKSFDKDEPVAFVPLNRNEDGTLSTPGNIVGETLIPTMRLRYVRQLVVTQSGSGIISSKSKVLQQQFIKPSGEIVWQDIPVIDEDLKKG